MHSHKKTTHISSATEVLLLEYFNDLALNVIYFQVIMKSILSAKASENTNNRDTL